MIRLGKDRTLDNYFIDENGVITDLSGNIQKVYFYGKDRPIFKGQFVHKIMMYTFYGYRDGHKWDIHHLDENKQNNSLSNLVYLTRSEHTVLHKKGKNHHFYGKHYSEEIKQKISDSMKGKHWTLSEETCKKMSNAKKVTHWFNDGVKNYRCKECPLGCVKGRLKISEDHK